MLIGPSLILAQLKPPPPLLRRQLRINIETAVTPATNYYYYYNGYTATGKAMSNSGAAWKQSLHVVLELNRGVELGSLFRVLFMRVPYIISGTQKWTLI